MRLLERVIRRLGVPDDVPSEFQVEYDGSDVLCIPELVAVALSPWGARCARDVRELSWLLCKTKPQSENVNVGSRFEPAP